MTQDFQKVSMMKKKHRKPADILRTIASPLASKHLYYRNGL